MILAPSASWYSRKSVITSSGSALSEKPVKPRRSQKSAVISLRWLSSCFSLPDATIRSATETGPILSGALRARQNVAISHDRFELLDQSPAIASLILWRRFDVLRSGRHDSVSDTYEIKSYKGIVRPRLLPIRCQPPADLETRMLPLSAAGFSQCKMHSLAPSRQILRCKA